MINLRSGDRPHPTLRQYLSLYWLATDDKIDPGWTAWGWFKRNPFYNALATVIGVNHLPRITASTDAKGDSFPAYGLLFASTLCFRFGYLPVCLPWIAWRGLGVEGGIGWKMNGTASITLRRQGAKNATEVDPK